MSVVTAERLIAACSDDSDDSGIRMVADLEPVAGPGAPVKPAIYAGGRYQLDRRWWATADGLKDVDVVVVDNVPSQANRLESVLERRTDLGLPRVILDLSEAQPLPAHLPSALSGFRFPHRHADAYLRDSLLDGTKFMRTKIGQELFAATAESPEALLQWFPHALLLGYWQSHLGKGKSQAKLARSWTSSIVGYNPATTGTKQYGLKGDPYNLTLGKESKVEHAPTDESDWAPLSGKAPQGRESAALSEIGHGQVPIGEGGEQPAGRAPISFEAIRQDTTVSFASLRRIVAGDNDANAAARALLVSLGLLAHVGYFSRGFSLRSGCDLRPTTTVWTWLGGRSDEDLDPLDRQSAEELFRGCVAVAHQAGLPVGPEWSEEPLVLQPSASLLKTIRSTYPVDE